MFWLGEGIVENFGILVKFLLIFFLLRRCILESLHSIFSHFRLKNFKVYIYKGEIRKKKLEKNDCQNLIKKKKMSEIFFYFFSNEEDEFLESLHSIFNHLQHKELATVSLYNKKLFYSFHSEKSFYLCSYC